MRVAFLGASPATPPRSCFSREKVPKAHSRSHNVTGQLAFTESYS